MPCSDDEHRSESPSTNSSGGDGHRPSSLKSGRQIDLSVLPPTSSAAGALEQRCTIGEESSDTRSTELRQSGQTSDSQPLSSWKSAPQEGDYQFLGTQ